MKKLATTLPALLLLAAAPAHASQIILKNGQVIEAQSVREATVEEVVFLVAGSAQRRPAAEVARILPSGDPNLDRALRLIERRSEPPQIATVLERVRQEWAKPYAQFFLAELYQQYNRNDQAVAAYDKLAADFPRHFYAPVGLQQAVGLLSGAEALKRLDLLASGQFGTTWQEAGQYGKGRLLLADGKVNEARTAFSRLSSARDEEVRLLAACAEAHCQVLAGDKTSAERTFRRIATDAKAPPSARGYAWKGLADCSESPDEALLANLRSVLLYPTNPERSSAATAAAELSARAGLGGDQRLRELARGGGPRDDYTGDQPSAELMRRTLQQVSAQLVQRFADELARAARGPEQADLEFLAADALRAIARANDDADMLAEYEARLQELQNKYPNHDRAATAGIEAFLAAKDRALALIAQAGEEQDEARRDGLLAQGRKLFEDVLGPFKGTIEEMNTRLAALREKDVRGELTPAEEEEQHELTFRRDLAEFQLAEAHGSFARTFPEGAAERKANFEQAIALYDRYVMERGNFQHLLFYSYNGRGEMLLALERFEEAAEQFEELTFVSPMFEPEDPAGQQAVRDLIKDVAIRAYYGWTRALLLAGKAQEAYQASRKVDENPACEGWREHPIGTLLTFERSKALAGAGRGAQGAQELYDVILRAQQVPESDKVPGLGMSRLGAGACRALSELSDLTGGEIYSAEIQYHVGVGYFLRQQPVMAIAGYKGVLTAAQTEEERRAWVPRTVREIGNLLFQEERYLEAALAYQTVFTEFPDHELAQDAVRFAVAASRRAIDQLGEDIADTSATIVAFSRAVEAQGAASGAGGAAYEQALIMNQAKELHERSRWLPAAEKYLEIVPDYTDDDGNRRRSAVYPNAVANAGYCYFKAFEQTKDERYLALARENLAKANEVAGEAGDRQSQALASLYLGQLENQLERHREALAALSPFDTVLADAGRYLVRARYEQAMAHLKLGGSDAAQQAEAAFRKIEDRTSDDHFGTFAYHLAVQLRTIGNQQLQANPGDIAGPRRLRARAGRYIKLWMDNIEPASLRDAVLFYLADVLFEGGQYANAHQLYTIVLGRGERPDLRGGLDRDAATEMQRFDFAELAVGVCLAKMGRHREAIDQLQKVRGIVYLRDTDDRLVGRGTLKDRRLSERTFQFTQHARNVQRKVWFTIIDVNGQETRFFDPPDFVPQGDERFQGIPGDDPTRPWLPSDRRTLTLPLKRDYMVVESLAEAAWALYQESQDAQLLVNEVTEFTNELRFVLRGMGDVGYLRFAAQNQFEPAEFVLRRWQSDVRYLRIKMARQSWREVLSDLNQMRILGTLDTAPQTIRAELDAIKAEAEARS